MECLAEDKQTVFIGCNTKNSYRANGTLKDVPDCQIIETPVAENLMMGLAIGMSLEGHKPIVFFERFDFILNAFDAIINHLDKLADISDGQFVPKVIVRVCVGRRTTPLFSGCTHTQDFTEQVKELVHFPVIKLLDKNEIFDAYMRAYHSTQSYMIIEENDLYRT
jgi:pyruvate/2-oxoglutarate/acetoin dehydrogenase E1 component